MPVLQRGCIKSIQRGYKYVSRNEFKEENNQITINISPINLNKSLILCDTNCYGLKSKVELLQSSIVIPDIAFGQHDIYIAYQVVEFY